MGISLKEFEVAMETLEAKRLYDNNAMCFHINGITFKQPFSRYSVTCDIKLPEGILNSAMTELGESPPGKYHFQSGEIHSILGILTIATMLKGNYSRELLDELTNKTYDKLFNDYGIKNSEPEFSPTQSVKLKELRKLVKEYDDIVFPYGSDYKLKPYSEYIDKVDLSVDDTYDIDIPKEFTLSSFSQKGYVELTLSSVLGNKYLCFLHAQENHMQGSLSMYHCTGNNPSENIIYLSFVPVISEKNIFKSKLLLHPNILELCISLNDGNVQSTKNIWTSKQNQLFPATDEQLTTMITHLKHAIKKIKQIITHHILA